MIPVKSMIPDVTIVAGPPGAGKTTYVAERVRHGDLVVDYDLIEAALTLGGWYDRPTAVRPFVCEARDAVLRKLAVRPGALERAWIVACAPTVAERAALRRRFLGAAVVVLETPIDECRTRLDLDRRRDRDRARWTSLLDEWWRTYELIPGEDVIAC